MDAQGKCHFLHRLKARVEVFSEHYLKSLAIGFEVAVFYTDVITGKVNMFSVIAREETLCWFNIFQCFLTAGLFVN